MILLFGIFVLIVIDYVQLEVPKYLGQTIDMLSESEVLSELDTIGESDEYKLVFTYDSEDRKSTRLNSSHVRISYAVFCLKKKKRPVADHHAHHLIHLLR